jgi:hypothetical protein
MTVAIALVSVQAMAMAPVITDIPSPIIGNSTGSTQATRYVYVDAFNLDALVSDDNTSDAGLKWSYEIVGTPKYSINGNASLTATEDPAAPPATKQIAGPGAVQNQMAGAAAETGEDGNAKTITIRNINLFPYGGSPSTNPALGGHPVDSQVVTFYCSDGQLAGSKDVFFYTDNTYSGGSASNPTGWNRLSGTPPSQFDQVVFDAKTYNWYADGLFGNVTTSTYAGKGVCLNVTPTGANFGALRSVQPYFQLTANTVYCIRATMNCTQASPGKTPFWDFILENWNGNVATGMNLYGMDTFFLDNEGGANAVITTAQGTELKMYWAPLPYQAPQWNDATNGAFRANCDAVNDPCLRFRVLDVDSNTALLNNLKSGGICLLSVVVEAIPDANLVAVAGAPPVNITVPADVPQTGEGGNMLAAGLLGSICNFADTAVPNTLKITPLVGGYAAELVEIRPATNRQYVFPGNTILDDWPIAWQANKIYKLEVELSAPDANSAAHPYDVMWLSIEPPTNEVITESFITATAGPAGTVSIGMPKFAAVPAPQKYSMFYYSGNGTQSAVSQLHNLRWRVRFANASNLNMPLGTDVNNNNGSVRLHSVKVSVVEVQ